jgi:hypothetical protein
MKNIKGLILAAIVLSLFGVGCGQKKDDNAGVGDARGDVRLSGGPVTLPQGVSQGAGVANVSSASSQMMTQEVRNFVSSFLAPELVGEVSNTNGVQISGRIQYDMNGTVLGQSYINLQISDSYVGSQNPNGGTVNPIRVMVPATMVQSLANSAGIRITFTDQFGTIIVEGAWNQSTFNGVVTFQNSRHLTAGAAPSQGTLGSFSIPVCSFIVCGG